MRRLVGPAWSERSGHLIIIVGICLEPAFAGPSVTRLMKICSSR